MRNVLLIGLLVLINSISIASFVLAQESNSQSSETWLTFLSHRSGHNLLYVSQQDGTSPKPIFGGPIGDVPSFDKSYTMFRDPHWTRQSPNGKYFASWVYEKGEPYSAYQGELRPMLWVGDMAGSWTRIVNPDCHEEFAWAPDSKQLAYSILTKPDRYRGLLQKRLETTEVMVSGIDGSNTECVLEQHGLWIVLDWSPDGERLLIACRKSGQQLEDGTSALFEFRIKDAMTARNGGQFDVNWPISGALKFLIPVEFDLGGLQFVGARYSPTRNEIAVETYDPKNMYGPNRLADPNNEFERAHMMRLLGKIHVLDLNSKALRKVADYEEGILGPICWSPEGNEILFSRYLPKEDDREKMPQTKEHGLGIWAIGRDGQNARFLTTGWSPDLPRLQPSAER